MAPREASRDTLTRKSQRERTCPAGRPGFFLVAYFSARATASHAASCQCLQLWEFAFVLIVHRIQQRIGREGSGIMHRRPFGADDRPACARCGGAMHVSRRTIHPTRGEDFEYQTLTCAACGHTAERTVDRAGKSV